MSLEAAGCITIAQLISTSHIKDFDEVGPNTHNKPERMNCCLIPTFRKELLQGQPELCWYNHLFYPATHVCS